MKDNSSLNFNKNWKFILGDIKNAQNPKFNDNTWKNIDIPHDWVIEQPFERGETGGWTAQNMQGFFTWKGICWYRKEFDLQDLTGKAVFIRFGGAYRNSTVYINGKEAGGRANGYISFELDITEFVKEGKNLIAVKLDNGCQEPDRWYSGSGLYRNVFLRIVPLTYVKTNGIQIDAKLAKNKNTAYVNICITIVNRRESKLGNLRLQIFKPDGKLVDESLINFNLKENEDTIRENFKLENPFLWSAEKPNLYSLIVNFDAEGIKQKPVEIKFGIRSIEIAYKKGMTVNGEKIKLKGVCLHHDAGITGSAYYDEVWRRRLLTLKSLGCNAIRTSHNPPAQEFLDLCDELGFYVIDECFDKWKSGYYGELFDGNALDDLNDFILRDRNHPCIFMWSVGNEVENQGADSMIAIQKKLVNCVKGLDDRPVTCALAPHANPRSLVGAPVEELVTLTKKLAKDVDVLGLNYHEPLYQAYTDKIGKPIVGTECYEFYSSVGTNFEDICDKNPWQFVMENDNVIGQFIWAGIDYLGESSWPAKGWSGSILDICGFMKPNAYFRKSIWSNEPFIYLAIYDQSKKNNYSRGRWSFPEMSSHLNLDHLQRRTVKAAIFTTCEEAELWINGKKMGRRKRRDFENGIIEWTFEYNTGSIEVKGLKSGKEVCNYMLKTAGQPHSIKLEADKMVLNPDEIAHVEINIVDKNGLLCPNEDLLVEFSLEGDGKILGACSGDLNQHLGFSLPKTFTSEGRALVMVKAGDNAGTLRLSAYSEKLKKAKVQIKVR